MLLLFSQLWNIGQKGLFVGIWKDGLLTELQARTSRDCRFLLFLHHNYQVSLTTKHTSRGCWMGRHKFGHCDFIGPHVTRTSLWTRPPMAQTEHLLNTGRPTLMGRRGMLHTHKCTIVHECMTKSLCPTLSVHLCRRPLLYTPVAVQHKVVVHFCCTH